MDEGGIWMVPSIVSIVVVGIDEVLMSESDGLRDDGGVEGGGDVSLDGMVYSKVKISFTLEGELGESDGRERGRVEGKGSIERVIGGGTE